MVCLLFECCFSQHVVICEALVNQKKKEKTGGWTVPDWQENAGRTLRSGRSLQDEKNVLSVGDNEIVLNRISFICFSSFHSIVPPCVSQPLNGCQRQDEK